MSVDLGSATLDVVFALSFVFFLLSIIATTLGEGIAAILSSRAKTLRKGLEGMLGDKQLVQDLLDHTLVRSNLTKKEPSASGDHGRLIAWLLWLVAPLRGIERGPSYVSPRNFAGAFQALVGVSEKDSSLVVTKKSNEKTNVDSKLTQQLEALATDAAGKFKLPEAPELEKWFDDAMDRVSGWYKRKSQLVTLVLAVVVTLALNANAIRIVERLASDPTTRAAVVAKAEGTAGESDGAKPAMGETKGEKELKGAGKDMEGAYKELTSLQLPLLWADENVPHGEDAILTAIAGWLLTIIAVSLGAPFWFDALGKIAQLRSAGKKPEASDPDPPAPQPQTLKIEVTQPGPQQGAGS